MDYVNILNTIRANASSQYQERVPEATKANLIEVGNPITTYDAVANEFLSILVNRIVMTKIDIKRYKNPLAKFKGEEMPYGYTIQNIHVNPAKAETFTQDAGENLLKKTLSEVQVEYYNINRKDIYPATIEDGDLTSAFTSADNFAKFVDGIFNSLYSGDSIDEYLLMRNLFSNGVTKNIIKSTPIDPITNEITANTFLKLARALALKMQTPSSNYNNYKTYTSSNTDVVTWTSPEDLLLIINADWMAASDVDSLSGAFNLSKKEFLGNVIVVDEFENPSNNLGLGAIVCDKRIIKAHDVKYKLKQFENGRGLYYNYYLHHWQTLSLSLFANAMAFTFDIA